MKSTDSIAVVAFNPREIATILHGLRMIQETANGHADCMAACCDHFEDVDPLTDAEIDILCERINMPKAHMLGEDLKAKPEDEARNEQYRQAAREEYAHGSDDNIEIDANAIVSESEDGAFVAAWVWVENSEDEDDEPEVQP